MAYNKFRNKPVRAEGKYFASQKEYKCWQKLCLAEKAGAIWELKFQVPFVIVPADSKYPRPVIYKADFVWYEHDKSAPWDCQRKCVVADAKGLRTQTYILKKRLMWEVHHIDVVEL